MSIYKLINKPELGGDYHLFLDKKIARKLRALGGFQGLIVLGLFLADQISALAFLALIITLTFYPLGLLIIMIKQRKAELGEKNDR